MLNHLYNINKLEGTGKIKSALKSIQNLKGSVPKGELSRLFLKAYKALGFEFPSERVCVVAGTNGKGSVVHCLSELLQSHGLKVGKFTSPHLVEVGERIQINGRSLASNEFETLLGELDHSLKRASDITIEALSFFEVLLLSAAYYFRANSVDFMVLEVGVGGRNDPVSQIAHDFNVFTSLSFDHKEILGESLREIFDHKIGIVKKPGVLVHGLESLESKELLKSCTELLGTSVIAVETPSVEISEVKSTEFEYKGQKLITGYFGEIGAKNSMMALLMFEQIVEKLKVPKNFETIRESFKFLTWPGRMQKVEWLNQAQLWVSGDHNPEGWDVLSSNLKLLKPKNIHIIFSLGLSKDTIEFLKSFEELPVKSLSVVSGAFNNKDLNEYPVHFMQLEILKYSDFSQVPWEKFASGSPKDLVVVCGSLYFVGIFLEYFRKSSFKVSD